MATAILADTAFAAAGRPGRQTIRLETTDADGDPVTAYTADGLVILPFEGKTDEDGAFRIPELDGEEQVGPDLPPTADIVQDGVYYTLWIGPRSFLLELVEGEQTVQDALVVSPADLTLAPGLDALSDVTASAPTDGQVLAWDDATDSWRPSSGLPGVLTSPIVTTTATGSLANEQPVGTEVLMSGLLAARPASGDYDGQHYLATDDQGGTYYRWNASGLTWARLAASVRPFGWFTAEHYGAVGDGVTDDRAAILAAATAAAAVRGALVLQPGKTYKVNKAVQLNNLDGLTIIGHGATVLHPSDDATVPIDGAATIAGHARSGFFVINSDDVRIDGVRFQGGSNATYTNHEGAGVYGRLSKNVVLTGCTYLGGSALAKHDEDDSLARHFKLLGCTSRNARQPITLPDHSSVIGCDFENDTAGFDYGVGSTHCIYLFAGRTQIRVEGCSFRQLRADAIKFSGTSSAVGDAVIAGCTFEWVGVPITFGADDTQDHTGLTVTGCTFRNCGTGPTAGSSGWATGAVIDIYGSRSVIVSGNSFHWDTDPASITGKYGILVRRYAATQPVESVVITGNIFDVRIGAGATSSATILTHAIYAQKVGEGIVGGGGLVVQGNVIGVGSVGVNVEKCLAPVVTGNTFKNLTTQIRFSGSRCPVFRNNTLVPGPITSSNAAIRLNGCSWPIIDGNITAGRAAGSGFGSHGHTWSVGDNANGSTPVDFPLLGTHGLVGTADGKFELVFAYGDGWTDGDTVVLNSNTYTYKGTSPGANEFNTLAGLIALLDAQSNFDAADYGAAFGGITTGHVRVRRTTASGSGTHTLKATCANRTAGVVLPNGNGANLTTGFFRGGQAAGTRVVIWSPCAHHSALVTLVPTGTAAAALMAANGFYEVARSTDDSNVVQQLEVGTTAGSEQWRWGIAG